MKEIVIVGILLVGIIVFLLKKNRELKTEKIRADLQKEEMANLILHDAEVEKKVSEKVRKIQTASGSELLDMSKQLHHNRKAGS